MLQSWMGIVLEERNILICSNIRFGTLILMEIWVLGYDREYDMYMNCFGRSKSVAIDDIANLDLRWPRR